MGIRADDVSGIFCSQCMGNNPREEVMWCADNFSVILHKIEAGRCAVIGPSWCMLQKHVELKAEQ